MIGGILRNVSVDREVWLPIVVAAYVFIYALLIIFVIRASRFFMFAGEYFKTAGKEQKLIRMELGKVAEEVHLLRQELKGSKEANSSRDSG